MFRKIKKVSREFRATVSGLAINARPLVRSVADTCKDLGIIGGFAYGAYEIFGKLLTVFF